MAPMIGPLMQGLPTQLDSHLKLYKSMCPDSQINDCNDLGDVYEGWVLLCCADILMRDRSKASI